jgi:hypothetical protein
MLRGGDSLDGARFSFRDEEPKRGPPLLLRLLCSGDDNSRLPMEGANEAVAAPPYCGKNPRAVAEDSAPVAAAIAVRGLFFNMPCSMLD